MGKLDRITIDPKAFGGKPCIRGMRFPVSKILDILAAGMSQEEILSDYPYLEKEDIVQAINMQHGFFRKRLLSVRANTGRCQFNQISQCRRIGK